MFWGKPAQKPEYDGANPRVFENPWYPLSGPPQTEEENKILTEYIQNEKKQLNQALMQKQAFTQSQSKILKEVAQSNCADIEYDYSVCLTTFNLKRFTTMCSSENERLKECIGIQTRNLELLGFYKIWQDQKKLMDIADKADDMYLEEMKNKK